MQDCDGPVQSIVFRNASVFLDPIKDRYMVLLLRIVSILDNVEVNYVSRTPCVRVSGLS